MFHFLTYISYDYDSRKPEKIFHDFLEYVSPSFGPVEYHNKAIFVHGTENISIKYFAIADFILRFLLQNIVKSGYRPPDLAKKGS